MYVIRNHEVLVVVEYGDEKTPSAVGIEVVPPLNEEERELVKKWMNGNNRSTYTELIDKLSHGDDASRYGEQVPIADTSKLERRMGELALCIRVGVGTGGGYVNIEREVREQKKDGILGT